MKVSPVRDTPIGIVPPYVGGSPVPKPPKEKNR